LSLLVFDCGVQDTLLFIIVIISMIHDFLSFYIVVSKTRSGKWKHFYGRPRATVNIATPLQ